MQSDKGYVHVYTGCGKGKTTAALGLALRCAGAGFKVFFGQFLKDGSYSETDAVKHFAGQITHEFYGLGGFIKGQPTEADMAAARNGLDRIKVAVNSSEYRLVIMDEINVAIYKGLIDKYEVLDLIKQRPEGVELVLTGRYADPDIMIAADLVTEMQEIKHYFKEGVPARTGIEK
jgi:cob(I)alamin adenosyltransferase